MPTTSKQVYIVRRPVGLPALSDFVMAEEELAPLADGQLLIRNLWISVDPYMRGRMVEHKTYIPPFDLNQPMEGAAVGEVVESRHPDFKPGDPVSHFLGWRDLAVVEAAQANPIRSSLPLQTHLGPLGFPGLAGYAGLLRLGEPRPGETVFVSAAAGAVGSLVAQIAMIKGARVVGSTGSATKAAWLLDELGLDAVINYKEVDDLAGALRQAAPDGVDIYFDNVGGAHLEAAIAVANDFARFPLCGMIDQYNGVPVGPRNIYGVIEKSIKLQGFLGSSHLDLWPQFHADVSQWILEGRVKWRETVVLGLENAPQAFLDLFDGRNTGKMLVKLGDA